jgi:hypothetical protein
MAKIRQSYNENKAKSLRDGTYFGPASASPDTGVDIHSEADRILGL